MRRNIDGGGERCSVDVLLGGKERQKIQILADTFVPEPRSDKDADLRGGSFAVLHRDPIVSDGKVLLLTPGQPDFLLDKTLSLPARAVPSGADEIIQRIQGMANLSRMDLAYVLAMMNAADREELPDGEIAEKAKVFGSDGEIWRKGEYLAEQTDKRKVLELFFQKFGEKDGMLRRTVNLHGVDLIVEVRAETPEGYWNITLSRCLPGGADGMMPISWTITSDKRIVPVDEGANYAGYLTRCGYNEIYFLLGAVLAKL